MQPKRETGDALGTRTSQASMASTLGHDKGMNAVSGLNEVDRSARKAETEMAEGIEQETVGTAWAVQLANEVAEKCFISNAQLLRRLMAAESALAKSTKALVPKNTQPAKVGDATTSILPLPGLATTSEASKPEASDRRGSQQPCFKRNGGR